MVNNKVKESQDKIEQKENQKVIIKKEINKERNRIQLEEVVKLKKLKQFENKENLELKDKKNNENEIFK